MKKISIRILLFSCTILLLFFFAACSPSRSKLPPPPSTATSSTLRKPPPVTTSDGRDSTFFMNSKNRGVCKAFKGKVLLNFFMVSDGDCIWTEDAIAEFKKTTEDAIYFLNYDSDRFGVELEILCNYVFVSHPETMATPTSTRFPLTLPRNSAPIPPLFSSASIGRSGVWLFPPPLKTALSMGFFTARTKIFVTSFYTYTAQKTFILPSASTKLPPVIFPTV